MSLIDCILLVPIIFGVVYGFYRGFFKELVPVVCIIVALFVSRYFGELVAIVLSKLIGCSLNVAKPVSFIFIFVATIIGLNILANIFTELTEILFLSWLNRLLGAFLGGVKWLIMLSVLVNLLSFFCAKTCDDNESRMAHSQFYKPIKNVLTKAIPLLRFDKFTNEIKPNVENNKKTSKKQKITI